MLRIAITMLAVLTTASSSLAVDKRKGLYIGPTARATEMSPTSDYATAKGFSFANSDNTLIDENAGIMRFYTNAVLAGSIDTGGNWDLPFHIAVGDDASVSANYVASFSELQNGAGSLTGIYSNVGTNQNNPSDSYIAGAFISQLYGSGIASSLRGVTSAISVDSNAGAGALGTSVAGSFTASHTGTSTVEDAYGIYISNVLDNSFGSPTIGNLFGIRIDATNTGGTVGGYSALSIEDVTGVSTTSWAITSAGGPSYHVGDFRIGSSVLPTVALDVTGKQKTAQTNTETSGTVNLNANSLILDPASASTSSATVLDVIGLTATGATNKATNFLGSRYLVHRSATDSGAISLMRGIQLQALNNAALGSGQGAVTTLEGAFIQGFDNSNTTTATTALRGANISTGISSSVVASRVFTTVEPLTVGWQMGAGSTSATITNLNVLNVDQAITGALNRTGTVTNPIGINMTGWTTSGVFGSGLTFTNAPEYIRLQSSSVAGNIGIRQQGTTTHNRFHGSVMIGADSTPATPLQVTGAASVDQLNLSATEKIRFDDGTGNEYSLFRNASNQMESRINFGGVFTANWLLTVNSASENSNWAPATAGLGDVGAIARGLGKVYLDESGAGTQSAAIVSPILASDITLTTPALTSTLSGQSSALTSTRVPFADANGLLTDDADMTFATDTLTSTKVNTTQIGTSSNGVGTMYFDESGAGTETVSIAAPTVSGNKAMTWPSVDATITGQSGALTSTRVPFVNANGILVDDTAMTFASTRLSVWNLTSTNDTFLNLVSIGGEIYEYNSIATEGNGVPAIYDEVNLTAQGAAIGATTMYTAPIDGFYRISAIAKVTRVATTSSTLGTITIGYTDGVDAVSQNQVMHCANEGGGTSTTNSGNNTSSKLSCTAIIYANASSNITYSVGYASSGATTMQYHINIRTEAL